MARTRRENPDRTNLTPREIVDQAIALADAEGLEAVTIRRLARALDVTPMALYWHFRNKDELLEGMAASLLEAVDLAVDPSAPWHDQLRGALGSLISVLRAHPATARLLSTRTVTSEGSLRATEALLDILRQGGFSPEAAAPLSAGVTPDAYAAFGLDLLVAGIVALAGRPA